MSIRFVYAIGFKTLQNLAWRWVIGHSFYSYMFAEQQRCFRKTAVRTFQIERKVSEARERYEGFSHTKFWINAKLWKGIINYEKVCRCMKYANVFLALQYKKKYLDIESSIDLLKPLQKVHKSILKL